jgi:hypothetical protein
VFACRLLSQYADSRSNSDVGAYLHYEICLILKILIDAQVAGGVVHVLSLYVFRHFAVSTFCFCTSGQFENNVHASSEELLKLLHVTWNVRRVLCDSIFCTLSIDSSLLF